ncbi:hypothetical protein JYT11_01025, partial [Planctomycetaceae bacterium AH-315-I19]|nr:hypothetical protein [Planctomycetaceae bacterium AH-315-I19]
MQSNAYVDSASHIESANRTKLTNAFNGSTTIENRISRPAGYNWDGAGGSLRYRNKFLGAGTPVQTEYLKSVSGTFETQWSLDRWADPNLNNPGSTTDSDKKNGEYPGFDRFGRTARQVWHKSVVGSGWDPDVQPAAVDYEYQYSKVSEVLVRYDRRAGGKTLRSDGSENYFYDGLNRLEEALRGTYDASVPSFTVGGRSQAWELDMLGNWGNLSIDNNGDGDYTDPAEINSREHNRANELIEALGGIPGTYLLEYDNNGNLTKQRVDLSGPSDKVFVYDAWNRLVRVRFDVTDPQSQQFSSQIRAEFTYYGGHQRATSLLETDRDAQHNPDECNHFYYDDSWRMLERRTDDSFT